METLKRGLERVGLGDPSRPGPQQRAGVSRALGDAACRRETAVQTRVRTHFDAVPDRAARDSGSGSQAGAPDHAVVNIVAGEVGERENAPRPVERPAPGREGPTAAERFERRAQEIARAAEVGERDLGCRRQPIRSPRSSMGCQRCETREASPGGMRSRRRPERIATPV